MDLHLYPCLACLRIFSLVTSAMSAVLTPPEMAEERTTRVQAPLPSPRLCTQRIELLKMTLNLSSLTDQQKYNDVVASVKNWADLDIMFYITILHDRRHGEPSSDEDTAAPDAGEGHPNKKRPDSAIVGCVSCVLGIHVNI